MSRAIQAVRETFLPFARPSMSLAEERVVVESLRSGWLSTGPKVGEFEARFAESVGAKHAVGLNSCTAGLHLSLLLHGIGPGDEVITSPITFASTVNVIVHTGARPAFAEVSERTFNLDPADVETRITPATRAVIVVHFAGMPCLMEEFEDLCRLHRLVLIEDAAHAAGSVYASRPIGARGNLTSFSFYATKNMTTGEGGMLVLEDDEMATRARVLRLHGLSADAWKRYGESGYHHWDIIEPGFKYNMMDLQAALGLQQLARLAEFNARRAEITARYDAAFAGLPGLRPLSHEVPAGWSHPHHLYVLLVDPEKLGFTRDEMMERVQNAKVGVGVHFRAVHLHPYYRRAYGFRPRDFPIAERVGDNVFSIPLFPAMTDQDVEDVIAAVRQAADGGYE
ncbi:MAG: DegT/DnrJ/EryC1/StrS aminotransferase family protein [Candidatus Tectomicrobia bacterium]|uniref:DegT/DnrJ/EryC1/StrS aminotransferase family protein n=1 Tax=Tectimicrobiota bacterium TaxID=2528274 RepID=A0A932HX61_UNCTE|nr:DegT/DnrJ/EryC1/StrS aminotransferase family protein [Candidatus Tectomicrobia bacterium]